MVIGHSMGGMMAARMATQYPKAVERVVIYNPIGLTDGRFERPMTPIDQAYEQNLKTDYQSPRQPEPLRRPQPEGVERRVRTYTRIRYSWTLSADWPRLAMVQALISQMLYGDPVVYDWAHIQVPTLAFGGAEDLLLGPAGALPGADEVLAKTIPNGNGRVHLIPGSATCRTSKRPTRCCRRSSRFSRKGSPRRRRRASPRGPTPSRAVGEAQRVENRSCDRLVASGDDDTVDDWTVEHEPDEHLFVGQRHVDGVAAVDDPLDGVR